MKRISSMHRVSSHLGLAQSNMFYIGLDIGGTFFKAAVLRADGTVFSKVSEPLSEDRSPDAIVELAHKVIDEAITSAGIGWDVVEHVGVGCPGRVERGCVSGAANLGLIESVPLGKLLEARFGKPVTVCNDADAALAAECWIGAAKGLSDAVMVTLGTGIGFGCLSAGRILQGATGTIEGGHMIMVINGRKCSCGSRGCLEAYASARSVKERTIEILGFASMSDEDLANRKFQDDTVTDHKHMIELARKSDLQTVKNIECKDVFDYARHGDLFALAIVDTTAQYLAAGLMNFSRVMDPHSVIISGGMCEAGEALLAPLREHMDSMAWTVLPTPQFVTISAVRNSAGVIGAAAIARNPRLIG